MAVKLDPMSSHWKMDHPLSMRHTLETSLGERRGMEITKLETSMRILVATDAWYPQVNGVVRTLTSLARSASALGADIKFLTPEGFPSVASSNLSGVESSLTKPRRNCP